MRQIIILIFFSLCAPMCETIMKKIYVFIILFFLVRPVTAQDSEWIEATGECLAVKTSPEEAKAEALKNARSSAIKTKGIKIASETIWQQKEINKKYDDIFSELVRASSNGIIKEEKVIKDTVEIVAGGFPLYRVTIKAKVTSVHTNPALRLALNVNKKTFSNGDKIKFIINSNFKGYLTVFNFYADGTVAVIFPNDLQRNCGIEAGRALALPDSAKAEWTVNLLPGQKQVSEGIFAVATRDSVPFQSEKGKFQDGFILIPNDRDGFIEINKWLLDVGNDRAEAFKTYFVGE